MSNYIKRIKDPVYGYIEIADELFEGVIDTPEFQRLKDVVQTSYVGLYPSTLHNRFVHSLGVYHLGRIAAQSVCTTCKDQPFHEILEEYRKAFELACLLHDVGHAPFSHTGEFFYLEDGKRETLHSELVAQTNDSELEKSIRNRGYKAAPHEILSAVIGIKVFRSIINEKYLSFFARCITGYKYENNQKDAGILNCYIELLNSKILDVDKIDYLIRDAYMSGFDSASIDYERLLGAISIEPLERSYTVCYSKAALSVVENVVYAHDLEKKWIQSHPTVLYETYLIKKLFEEVIEQQFSEYRYIPQEVLSKEGLGLKGYGRIRLASDSDMTYLMKNLKGNSHSVEEYFDRRKRKHPIWKTEAEFQAIFKDQDSTILELNTDLKDLESSQRTGGILLNDEVLESLEIDIDKYKNAVETEGDETDKKLYMAALKKKQKQKELIEIFKSFSGKQGIPFDYLILYADYFNSSFKKTEFGDLKFKFPMLNGLCRFEDVSNVLRQLDSKGDKFFYIFHSKGDKEIIRFGELIKELIAFAGSHWSQENAETVGNRISEYDSK